MRQHEWHRWFAWRPVVLTIQRGQRETVVRFTWLAWIERRRGLNGWQYRAPEWWA